MTPREFLSKIKTSEGCSVWEGSSVKGHGEVIINGEKMYAHRAAYLLCVGPIPDGLFILHKCNNGLCIKPDHLYAGTQKQNVRDAVNAGGFGTSKLDRQAVIDILKRHYADKQRDASIARHYKVSQTAISQIVKGRHYPDIFNEVMSNGEITGELAGLLPGVYKKIRAASAV